MANKDILIEFKEILDTDTDNHELQKEFLQATTKALDENDPNELKNLLVGICKNYAEETS